MEANTMISVRNRCGATVVYSVPELNRRRQFQPNEVKRIPYEELEAVSYQQGGRAILYHYLLIEDQDALRQLINGKEEPEYWLTVDKIPGWINSCTREEFEDALNFAPEGVKQLIRDFSVSVPLTDTEKRKLVLKKLNFDVDAAVRNNAPEEETQPEIPVRVAAPTPGVTTRKTNPTYKITKPAETN